MLRRKILKSYPKTFLSDKIFLKDFFWKTEMKWPTLYLVRNKDNFKKERKKMNIFYHHPFLEERIS